MSQSVVINNVTYNDVPAIQIPAEGGGTATFYDASGSTVTAGDMLAGVTAVGSSGTVTGNIPTKTSSDLTSSADVVTVPAGYYASSATKSVGTATLATPSISVNSSTGVITATVTQSAGYVSAGSASDTESLSVQAAQTITPGTSNQTIAAGKYLTGAQTILGDANLVSASILGSKTIFGVTGNANNVDTTIATSAASAADIMSGYKAYVNGTLITGNATVPTVSQDGVTKILSIS